MPYNAISYQEVIMAKAEKVKQLVVEGPDRVGLLADITGTLAAAKINILSICCYGAGGKSSHMLIVDQHPAAKRALTKAGFAVREDNVIRLELANKPGELAKATAAVSGSGVDMEYVYGTATGRSSAIVIKSRDDARALRTLKKQ
jgi:hypothetical protein